MELLVKELVKGSTATLFIPAAKQLCERSGFKGIVCLSVMGAVALPHIFLKFKALSRRTTCSSPRLLSLKKIL